MAHADQVWRWRRRQAEWLRCKPAALYCFCEGKQNFFSRKKSRGVRFIGEKEVTGDDSIKYFLDSSSSMKSTLVYANNLRSPPKSEVLLESQRG